MNLLKHSIIKDERGFTLFELLMVMSLIAVLSGSLLIVINPPEVVKNTRETRARLELREVGNAMTLYIAKYGELPDDVWRDLPSGLEEFLPGGVEWPNGPYPGSVYDWDNWSEETCWNGQTGIVQITLREIPGYGAGDDWTMRYVIYGMPGVPHCSNSSTQGECINCGEFAD